MTHSDELGRVLDRLVDGALPEKERRELLLRLEREADGWRRCSLAFLEAQTWRAALVPLTATRPAVRPTPRVRRWPRVARLIATAAGIVVAFVLGRASLPRAPEPTGDVPIVERKTPLPEDDPPPAVVSPLKQLEQQGLRAETERRVVSLELKDGRKVNVPVQEVRLRYVGGRTY